MIDILIRPFAVALSLATLGIASLAADAPEPDDDPRLLAAAAVVGAEGRSGALRIAIASPGELMDDVWIDGVPLEAIRYRWEPVAGSARPGLAGETPLALGLVAPAEPGAWHLRLSSEDASTVIRDFTLITPVPATAKRNGFLNGYHVGRYATRDRRPPDDPYAAPEGFIEVTESMRTLPVSDHLQLGDFLTKDQWNVWPKYLVLDLALVDKLELVLKELRAMGAIRSGQITVMSGYRTPQYNGPGGNGRASLSRHTFGDAADIWIDEIGDGRMDDLNGDGRVDQEDVRVILRAVERVEERYPDLVGGAGVYRPAPHRGPFIHIDTRGHPTRW